MWTNRTIQVFILFFIVAAISASDSCDSDACENAAYDEELSLIQGLIEPDFVRQQLYADDDANIEKLKATKKTTTTKPPTVKGTKIKTNGAGDLPAFLAGIRFDIMLFMLFFGGFMVVAHYYPIMYYWREGFSDEAKKDDSPQYKYGAGFSEEEKKADPQYEASKEDTTPAWLRWFKLSYNLTPETMQERGGLDARMLLRFSNISIYLMLVFGVPSVIIGIPIYFKLGGGMAQKDRLSWAGIGNVVFNNTIPGEDNITPALAHKIPEVQWIYYVVAFAVWFVVIVTQWVLFHEQRNFIKIRQDWLLNMPEPRSLTALVEGIPPECRTDASFRANLEKLFPGTIDEKKTFVVRNLSGTNIRALIGKYEEICKDMNQTDLDPQEKNRLKGEKEAKAQEIKDEQAKFLKQDEDETKEAAKYTHNGFVVFKEREDAERALGLTMSEDEDKWVFQTPPDPNDIRYHDFEIPENKQALYQWFGYALVTGLFFAFMPIVIGISQLSEDIESTPFIHKLVKATGFEATLKGVLATVGLTIMMAMLPTFLMWIFKLTYTLKAERWAQLVLQEYYFWFLVLFVLLVTAIGTNLAESISKYAHSPFLAFKVLADKLPASTHFYLAYSCLQPVTHGMNLSRYFYMAKFAIGKKFWNVRDSKAFAEPEDQDYYGMGSRSARFALVLSIGLIFGTICPLMYIPVLVNFLVCRMVYGYLIPYAENKKVDMGGAHWCMQLIHVHLMLLVYLIMMTGIGLHRAESKLPGFITACSFVWWFISYRKYRKNLHWETLPYMNLMNNEGPRKSNKVVGKYYQEDLSDDWAKEANVMEDK